MTKEAAESSVDAAGDVIHYTIVVSNTGNTALTGVSVNDPLLANEDCDGAAGAPFTNSGLSIPKGGSLTCTGTYTVTQADIDNNGGGDGDIDNTVDRRLQRDRPGYRERGRADRPEPGAERHQGSHRGERRLGRRPDPLHDRRHEHRQPHADRRLDR